ncbi:MAG TPA: glycosyltransferase family 1 protein [Phototrophicaceae bacterium]|nr:glycosyltransferase family 1 protein [Phototrophicaceae bacterium]
MSHHSALITRHSTIAIDYTPAYEQGGGIGRYVRELVAALARQPAEHEYRLFVSGAKTLPTAPGTNFVWKSTRLTPKTLARLWQRAQIPLPAEFFTGAVDLYHATDFVLPPTRARSLLTVHDLSFVRVPEAASPALKAYLDAVVPRSVRRADHVLADSQATKDDLIALYNTPAEKITVLLSGVDARFHRVDDPNVRAKYKIPARPYIFSVGTVQPRKNYSRLIQALAVLRSRGHDLDLVIAGGRGWLEDPIYASIRDAQMNDYVHFIGFADDADLPALYSAAQVTAIPSLYEGFGIPVLESMACGTPVVTSNVSSLPEVAGDAALTITPTDLDALIDALERLITDETLRSVLITKGLTRAREFTWDRSALQLRQIYDQML